MRHQLGLLKFKTNQALQALLYKRATPWSQRLIAHVWENQAEMIHNRWGEDQHDFAVIGQWLAEQKPRSILDIGCGSGRLFGLYQHYAIQEVIGVDISARALDLARQRYPLVETRCGRVEDLDFATQRFDLAISNRVLQHLPPHTVGKTIQSLCRFCRAIYINELTASDQLTEEFYMFHHPYPTLFAQAGWQLRQTGMIGQQTYQIYEAGI